MTFIMLINIYASKKGKLYEKGKVMLLNAVWLID